MDAPFSDPLCSSMILTSHTSWRVEMAVICLALVFTIPVAPGDVIAGTDGLFDNLYNNEVAAAVVHAMRAGLGPQVTAQKIAALARRRAQNKNRQTPFSTAAQDAGFRYYGGKLDDITVIVSYIPSTRMDESSPSVCESG